MTVKELIEILEKYDPTAEISIDYSYLDGELGWCSREYVETFIEEIFERYGELHISTYKQND